MVEIHQAAKDVFNFHLHRYENQGWPFNSGDPEIWKFQDLLLDPQKTALDLGVGYGASSLFFALHGMSVVGMDKDLESSAILSQIAEDHNLPIKVVHEDIQKADLAPDYFHLAIMNEVFNHFPSQEAAFDIIQKALNAVYSGGYLWIRAAGQDASFYNDLLEMSRYNQNVKDVGNGVVIAPCNCSGELKIEPHLFFPQTKIMEFLLKRNTRIVYSRIMPENGKANTLFGEDWRTSSGEPLSPGDRMAMIAILAQKK